jgi:hypothetical protein
MQVFCFFISQEGNAFAYASPNFQAALDQPHLDALKQVTVFAVPPLTHDISRSKQGSVRQLCSYVVRLQPRGTAWNLHTKLPVSSAVWRLWHMGACARDDTNWLRGHRAFSGSGAGPTTAAILGHRKRVM